MMSIILKWRDYQQKKIFKFLNFELLMLNSNDPNICINLLMYLKRKDDFQESEMILNPYERNKNLFEQTFTKSIFEMMCATIVDVVNIDHRFFSLPLYLAHVARHVRTTRTHTRSRFIIHFSMKNHENIK